METSAAALAPLMAGVIFGCLFVWMMIFGRLVGGQEIVPYAPRFTVPWTGPDLAVIAVVVMMAYSVAPLVAVAQHKWNGESAETTADGEKQPGAATADESASSAHAENNSVNLETTKGAGTEDAVKAQTEEEPSRPPPRITPLVAVVQAVASLVCCAIIVIGLRLVAGATWHDLGVTCPQPARDFQWGVAGMLAASVPVYTIQAITTYFFPSAHPLIEMLQKDPNATNLLLSMGLAVIVAPVVEEFLFRVLIQGWLEAKEVQWMDRYPMLFRVLPRGSVPITLSALIFALAHSPQGPDPIALFPLAVVLGYLYRQTHRLWPSAIMHLAFNGLSLTTLWVALAGGAGAT